MRLRLLIILLLPVCLIAQNDSLFSGEINLSVGGNLSSTGIERSMIQEFYSGGFINEEIKTASFENLSEENRLGFEAITEFEWKSNDSIQLKGWKPWTSIRHRQLLSTNFSQDLFELVFFGNSQQTGNAMNFNDFSVFNYNYQSINLGLYKSFKNVDLGVQLGLIRSGTFTELSLSNGSLLTSNNGSNLELTTNGSLIQSDTSLTFHQTSGWGSAINLDFTWRQTISEVRLKIRDLGFIQLNDQTYTQSLDTNVTFSGIEINNILSPEFESGNDENLLDTIIPSAEITGVQMIMTPASLQLEYERPFKQLSLIGSVDYILNANYFPHFQVEVKHKSTKNFIPSIINGYGGFTKYHMGVGANIRWNKWTTAIYFSAIQGLISSSGLTQSAVINLKYHL